LASPTPWITSQSLAAVMGLGAVTVVEVTATRAVVVGAVLIVGTGRTVVVVTSAPVEVTAPNAPAPTTLPMTRTTTRRNRVLNPTSDVRLPAVSGLPDEPYPLRNGLRVEPDRCHDLVLGAGGEESVGYPERVHTPSKPGTAESLENGGTKTTC